MIKILSIKVIFTLLAFVLLFSSIVMAVSSTEVNMNVNNSIPLQTEVVDELTAQNDNSNNDTGTKKETEKNTNKTQSEEEINEKKSNMHEVFNRHTKQFNKNDNLKYTNVQGFCSDGQYWYIALLTHPDDTKNYTDQTTTLLKIDISTKEIVGRNVIGKIGHSNSLAYNSKTNKIYSASCSKEQKAFLYEFDASTLEKSKEKVYLYDEDGKNIKDMSVGAIAYNSKKDQYIAKMNHNQKEVWLFDSNFKYIKKITIEKHSLNGDGLKGQGLTCDEEKFYSVCCDTNGNKPPFKNYVLIYDMNGNGEDKKELKKVFKRKPNYKSKVEMEQIAFANGTCYSLSNVTKIIEDGKKEKKEKVFMIDKLDLK